MAQERGQAVNFTRRTYRVAIRRSILKELELLNAGDLKFSDQLAHTARLQRRKRKERK